MKNKFNITSTRCLTPARARVATALMIIVPVAWIIVLTTMAIVYGTAGAEFSFRP